MARPGTRIAIRNVDKQINRIADQLKRQIDTLREEVDLLSERYERLTGFAPATNGMVRGRRGGAPAAGPERGGHRRGKRIRRLGVDVAWISGHLKSKPMTLKQLQDVALAEGRSALSVMTVLRTNKARFKSSAGTKDASQRGRAAQVWSAK